MAEKNDLENNAEPQRSPEELRMALQECTKRQIALREQKKAVAKDYADQIKEIDHEIADILSQLD
jgi:ribosomal protein L29